MDVERFARFLYEELDRDGWGDVDPFLLKAIGEGGDARLSDDAYALKEALARALARMEKA